ncbi:MAG: UDP-N-acetylmuramate--L-alanine ligase [Planctomycetota bacterium]
MHSHTVSTRTDAHPSLALPRDLQTLRVHMVGIAGSGMSGLAAFLLRRGAVVSGSDRQAGEEVTRLIQSGATIGTEQTAATLPLSAEYLVKSAAIPEDHAEVVEARRRGLPVFKYAELLGHLMSRCDGIAISGTHGKSTTTAWLAYVLKRAGLDPNFVIGAGVDQLGGGSGVGDGPHFVAEACEYDRSFLNLRPRRAAILNIEEDHLDYYADLDEIAATFTHFTTLLPADGLLVLNADDPCCRALVDSDHPRLETFGTRSGATWRAANITLDSGRYSFDVLRRENVLGRVALGIAGQHNILNSLAVIALATDCGVPWETLVTPLEEFHGARRRLEFRGEVNGIRIIDDYAHHPTEIIATLQAARESYQPRRLWCVFQPHQHSRTRFFMSSFAESFSQADRVVVPDIFFVRDSQLEREAVCAADLVAQIRQRGDDAEYVPTFAGIVERLVADVAPGDVVLTMGAGNIWKVADELLRQLQRDLPT